MFYNICRQQNDKGVNRCKNMYSKMNNFPNLGYRLSVLVHNDFPNVDRIFDMDKNIVSPGTQTELVLFCSVLSDRCNKK